MRQPLVLAAALALAAPSLAWCQEKKVTPPPPTPQHRLDGRTIVFVVDGAGGSTVVADYLRDAVAEAHAPLILRPIRWCQVDVPIYDIVDHKAQLQAAAKLAGTIACLRRDCPTCRIVLIGHSSGARVVLAAAEAAPPQSINRIILLASAVSSGYDLGPALRGSRGGIDAFSSQFDTILALAADITGAADGKKNTQCAGQVGFRHGRGPAHAHVRQYAWGDGWPGQGDHYTWVWPGFLQRTLIPMTLTDVLAPAK